MIQDISLEHNHLCAARTPGLVGFVYFRCGDPRPVRAADLLVLRDANGAAIPARFIGMVHSSAEVGEGMEVRELIGAYRIAVGGTTLDVILGDRWKPAVLGVEGHDWGAMGLPNGARTPVVPLDGLVTKDDVGVAFRSAGYGEFESSLARSVAPGDAVTVVGQAVTVIAIDRRKRAAEVEHGDGDTRTVTFDDIEGL